MIDGFDGRGGGDPAGLAGVPRQAAEAAAALEAIKAPAERAAGAIEDAFGRAGASLVRSLGRAAADGEVTLAELARGMLAAVNAAFGGGRSGGLSATLGAAVAGAVGGLFRGARADGGPVGAGGAYLVGERGPEVFRPAVSGAVEPLGAPSVNVTVQVSGGAEGLLRSEAQVAQALARAVGLGVRR